MKRFVMDIYHGVLLEAGTSFLLGALSASVKSTFSRKNIILSQRHAVRKGLATARHALIHGIVLHLLARLKIRAKNAHVIALFTSGYFVGKRNGVLYAIRNGGISLLIHLLTNIY